MKKRSANIFTFRKELFFQILLHSVVLVFYIFDRHHPKVEDFKFLFFANYACAAFLINYFLLPRFLYTKRYFLFFLYLTLVLTGVTLFEKFFLEQMFFPNNKKSQLFFIWIILGNVLPVITILSGFKFAWDALKKQQEVDTLKTTAKESELQFLKSQINPHFLFNNLNNLYSHAIENSPKTPDIILELSAVLRYMLYECKEEFVPLNQEIEQLKNFVRLYELQIEERGNITFETQNIMSGYRVAPLILIVFIENAFKHSMASQAQDITINIQIEQTADASLHFTCANSFLPKSNNERLSHGIGLQNVKKRLNLLYPNAHQLSISDDNNWYEVKLSLQPDKKSQ